MGFREKFEFYRKKLALESLSERGYEFVFDGDGSGLCLLSSYSVLVLRRGFCGFGFF